MKVIFVIPAYNEERNLPRLFANLKSTMETISYPYEIVIVDDGSQDGTGPLIKKLAAKEPIHLITHEVNKGPGEAFLSGFAKALEIAEDHDIIITKEADNTGDYHLIEPMIENIRSQFDMALASCYAEGGRIEGTTWDRLILSRVANLMLGVIFPTVAVRTYSSFYRAYNAGVLRQAAATFGDRFLEEKGFACMVELLIKMHRIGAKMVELPMVLRCQNRTDQSKMRRLRTMFGLLRVMVKKGLFRR